MKAPDSIETPEAYLAGLPDGRRQILEAISFS